MKNFFGMNILDTCNLIGENCEIVSLQKKKPCFVFDRHANKPIVLKLGRVNKLKKKQKKKKKKKHGGN